MSGEFKSADRSYQTSKGDPTAKVLAPVVLTLDCAIHSINQHYPHFDQLVPVSSGLGSRPLNPGQGAHILIYSKQVLNTG